MSIKGSGDHFVAKSIASESGRLRVPPRKNGVTTVQYVEDRFPEYTMHVEPGSAFLEQQYASNYSQHLEELNPDGYIVRTIDHEEQDTRVDIYEEIGAEELERELKEILDEETTLSL